MLQGVFSRRNVPPRDADTLVSHLLGHIEQSGPIRCPLLLISQISRSGGTWLSQLLDHHPQVWAHPLELRFGDSRRKWQWPDLSAASDVNAVWNLLRYAKVEERLGSGAYNKGTDETHPMLFRPDVQHRLFLKLAAEYKPSTDREWLDIYFTSFFSAWLDHQRRYGAKHYVTAFASMLALAPSGMARFRQAYPDGWLVSVIREPLGWYASVKQRSSGRNERKSSIKPHYYGPEAAETAYLDNVRAMHDNGKLFGEQFILVDYQSLVSDTEAVMRTLAARIGLEWDPVLTRQTFNGRPIKPNTSFPNQVSKTAEPILTEEDVARISNGAMMAAYLAARPQA